VPGSCYHHFAIIHPPAVALASSESLLKASDESSRKMHDRAFWDGWDGSWDGLGRPLGRIKHAKSSMFTGLGTVGRINWGGEGYPLNPKLEIRSASAQKQLPPSLGSYGETSRRDKRKEDKSKARNQTSVSSPKRQSSVRSWQTVLDVLHQARSKPFKVNQSKSKQIKGVL